MTTSVRLFDRVRVTTNKFAESGAPDGAVGFVIGTHGDHAFEVEVTVPGGEGQLAHIIADPDDLKRAEPGA
jgi:hypothetical protein